MTSGRAAFDALLRDWLAPFFKQEGFRKTRQTFWMRGDGTWGLINLQKSAWNVDDDVDFYVNVAVTSDRLLADVGERRTAPPEYECAIRRRLHRPGTNQALGDWTLHSLGDVESVAASLIPVLEEDAVPFLRRLSSDAAILDYWTDILDRDESEPIRLPAVLDLAESVGRRELATRVRSILERYQRENEGRPRLTAIQSIELPHRS